MIYSIGHGNKDIDVFINEIKSFNIKYLIDVRSKPYSKYNSQFNREALKTVLEGAGITYVFMGDTLGGLPSDKSCYIDGKVDYELIKEKDFFKEGLKRLLIAHEKNINVAIMCSESNPHDCHRSKLIGQELFKNKVSMNHIISSELCKGHVTVMNELNKGKNFIDLFENEKNYTSKKTYT